MVVADNIAVHVDRVYMLQHPPLIVLAVGTLAFAIQIYADFSGYTDIARGCARLLGFNLMENFRAPYLAVSPSDFWRRWHISFSTWIRDYLYIPLGGSRVRTAWQFALVLLVTLGLSGLWHGAQWHFVAWGGYWAAILFVFHRLGLAGRWAPTGGPQAIAAWGATFSLTLVGWAIFRAPDLGWLSGILRDPLQGSGVAAQLAAACIAGSVFVYSLPLLVTALVRWLAPDVALVRAVVNGLLLASLVLLARTGANDFIYFQF
jgi:D-alanyl-lipoteichoic acid acyltransferase DltB (MBOAT superfamily)